MDELFNALCALAEWADTRIDELNEEMYHLDGISISRAYMQGKKDAYAYVREHINEIINKEGRES